MKLMKHHFYFRFYPIASAHFIKYRKIKLLRNYFYQLFYFRSIKAEKEQFHIFEKYSEIVSLQYYLTICQIEKFHYFNR